MFQLPVKPEASAKIERVARTESRPFGSVDRFHYLDSGRYFIELSRSWPRSRRLPGYEGRVQLIERGHVETAVSARSQISLDSAKSIRRIPRDIEGPYWRVAVSRTFMKFSSTLRFLG